ncbi:MAG TPA: MarR family transcriptional regulator [bacterium]|nr:MarR family transcriptional regulator [bacterium]
MPTKRTPKAEALTELILEAFRFRGELERHGRRIVEPFGQTPTGWLVLGAVDEEPRTVSQIARRMGVTRQGVQRVAHALVKNRHAAFADNPDHRRSPILTLTPRGRQVLARIDAVQAIWSNRLAEPLPLQDLANAVQTIRRVTDRLKSGLTTLPVSSGAAR